MKSGNIAKVARTAERLLGKKIYDPLNRLNDGRLIVPSMCLCAHVTLS